MRGRLPAAKVSAATPALLMVAFSVILVYPLAVGYDLAIQDVPEKKSDFVGGQER